ncbi:MAG TPA: methionine synthase [Chloroflexota bacterium]|jgi:5-methyltetrahydrofolate--homocysteine methyltransferase|nr:methionine synthase [Chloroflexota bacterium]
MTARPDYLQTLNDRVLIFDGAMGTSIQNYDLTAEDFGGKEGCNDYLVLTRPDIISAIHNSFLAVGCDVLETDTFNASRLRLDEYGLGHLTHELNVAAAQLARAAANAYSTPERPRFVAGSIGPSGYLPSSDDPSLGRLTYTDLAAIFAEQAGALIAGGVDLLIIETAQDILELKAVIAGARQAMRDAGRSVPIQAQVTLDVTGRMLLGTDIGACMVILESVGADVIGMNCSTGPEHMREPVRYLSERCTRPISVIPNAGIPLNVAGKAVFPLTPRELAAALLEFVEDHGVNVVGGCCGTTPEHMQLVVQAIGTRRPKPLARSHAPMIAGAIRAVDLLQEPPPLLVGERVNAQGSRAVKRMVLAEDYDGLLAIGRHQVDGGAHALDVQVAVTERGDEAAQMRRTVKKLSTGVEAPLVIDSTEANVIKEALEQYPGRAIVNSINMENGRLRIEAVLPLVRDHGAAVVALTIDEVGMARTAERKLEVARRIHQIATEEYGLHPEDLIFDALTFVLSTGEEEWKRSGIETLDGIRQIKRELPGVLTILGVSNVSFGLTPHARAVLNSVFLYHAVEAGLDLAIINPKDVLPYAEIPGEQRALADDLVFDRRPDALARLIEYFQHTAAPEANGAAVDPTAGMSEEERIHYQILHRKKDGIEALIDQALTRHGPVDVLNNVLLPAMKDVGDKFGAGELILPFVLQSAEVMKRAVAHLEQFLERKEGYSKGTVVLATVFGDVHDIGKNLVNTILTNNGYVVHDLGKQVPINVIVDKALEVNADAIGLSALLVSTSKQMGLCVAELHRRELAFPVLIGGAAINREYSRRIAIVEDDHPYGPGVFYCKDAFDGLETMDGLGDPVQRESLVSRVHSEALEARNGAGATTATAVKPARPHLVQPAVASGPPSGILPAPVPAPPFWGVRALEDIDLRRVFKHLALRSLFRLSWGARNTGGAEWTRLLKDDFMPRLRRMQRDAIAEGWLQPRAVYGYFPCYRDGEDLVILSPEDRRTVLERFSFPRQDAEDRLCISDYFGSDPEQPDLVSFQVVTVGTDATTYTDHLQRAGNYSESFFTHGLSVETAEALAEYVHRHIRRELQLGPTQGKRYSWGYPACPDLEDHEKVFRLLPAEQLIGVSLTTAYQLVPEQSTAAIVAHHPRARYFSVRAQRHQTA